MNPFYKADEMKQKNYFDYPLFESRYDVPQGYYSTSIKTLLDGIPTEEDVIAFFQWKNYYYPLFKLHTPITVLTDEKMPFGYERIFKNDPIIPTELWYHNGRNFPIQKHLPAEVSPNLEKYVDVENLQLKGIFSESIVRHFTIPFEQTKIIAYVEAEYYNIPLYEVPFPYSEIPVCFSKKVQLPNYYFRDDLLRKYDLKPIEKEELPVFIHLKPSNARRRDGHNIWYYYDRKHEPKYRIQYALDPQFNPIKWEKKRKNKKKN